MTTLTQADAQLQHLLSRKGQIVTLVTERDCRVRKDSPSVRKRSEFQCRVGVAYDNIKAVQEKRKDGELPMYNAGLPWGTWALFPYVIEHKGELYIRCTVVRNNFKASTQYTVNGAEIDRDTAQHLCLASEFAEGSDNDVFNIKISSIVSIR